MATKYAEVTYPNVGGGTEFTIPFKYLEQSHLKVTLDAVTQVNGTDYTINETTSKVVFSVATPANDVVVISRTTPIATADLAVTFEDGSGMNAEDLNDSAKQNIFAVQEMNDTIDESIDIVATAMLGANNLSDVDNTGTSRTNLDVYSKTETDSVFADASLALLKAQNLSDVASTSTSRTNLDVYSKSESDNLAKMRVVSLYSDLRSVALAADISDFSYMVQGRTAVNDGGEGIFKYDSSLVSALDDGTILRPGSLAAGDAGRWTRLNTDDVFNVKWFGATGDGTTDDKTAIQDTITNCSGKVIIPTGLYNCGSELVLPFGVSIVGMGSARQTLAGTDTISTQAMLKYTGTGNFITFTGCSDTPKNNGFELKNLSLVQSTAGTVVGKAINIVPTSDSTAINWITIEDVNIEKQSSGLADWSHGIYLDGSATTTPSVGIRDVWLNNIRTVGGTNATSGIYLNGCYNVFIDNVMCNLANNDIDIVGSSAAVYMSNIAAGVLNVNGATNVYTASSAFDTIQTDATSSGCNFNAKVNTTLTLDGTNNVFMGDYGNRPTIARPSTADEGTLQVIGTGGYAPGVSIETISSGTKYILGQVRGDVLTGYADGELQFNVRSSSALTKRLTIRPAGDLFPGADNTQDIGSAALRWAVVYAGTGTINTSDGDLKQDIKDLDASELAVAVRLKGLMKTFRFKDAVASKGDDARIHCGIIAQDVRDAFIAEGLDPERYSIFCKDMWYVDADNNILEEYEDGAIEVTRLGIRYDELLCFIIAAL